MVRAGVFIGVQQTGGLITLRDAIGGAQRMHGWALSQGMPDKTHAKLITDDGGKRISPEQVFDAIQSILSGAGVDQLILYFAGHGVNINRSEHWLLTDAPVRSNAAINVSGSVELARYCGVSHVVVISDACRVAAEGIQAQNVRGQDVFPNDVASDKSRPVDQFFACLLGRASAEMRDPALAAGNYRALYTSALLDALKGEKPEVLEKSTDGGTTVQYVKPVPLEVYLEAEVPRRIKDAKLTSVNQDPDAIITAHAHWISRIAGTQATQAPVQLAPLPPFTPGIRLPRSGPTAGGAPVVESTAHVLAGPGRPLSRAITKLLIGDAASRMAANILISKFPEYTAGAAAILASVPELARTFGPTQFETQCGFKVRGARVVEAFSSRAKVEHLGPAGDVVRIDTLGAPAASVVLEFDDGSGTVVPALRDFIAAIIVEDNQIVDIAYEPSENSWRAQVYASGGEEIRRLRAIAAAATNHDRFRLDGDDAMAIAARMQAVKGADPTLSIYAAYAYHDLQAMDRIRDMSRYQHEDLGIHLFDVALLSRELIDATITPDRGVVPFTPLLAQGWSLLNANRFRLHPALVPLQATLRESLWSSYLPPGVQLLRAALASGELA